LADQIFLLKSKEKKHQK